MGLLSYFDRFEETKGEVITLVTASLILNFGFGVLIPFIPIYALDLGASVAIIGIIIAGFTIGRAISAGLAGAYSDRVGRKRVMVWGTLLYVITTGGMAFVPNWQFLVVLRLLEGMAVGIVWPTAQAYLIDIVPRSKVGEASGIYTTTFSMGFFIGPMLGSTAFYLTETAGGTETQALQSTFLVTAALALVALVFIIIKIRDFDPTYYELKNEKENIINPAQNVKLTNPRSEYKKYYTMSFLNGMGIGFIIPIFSIFFVDVHNFGGELVGFIIGVAGGIMAFVASPSGYFGDKYGRKPFMIIGLPIMVINTALLGFATTVFLAAGFFWLRAVGLMLFLPNFRALQADVVIAKERGAIFGRVQTYWNIGAVIGPIFGSYVYDILQGETYDVFGYEFIGEAVPFLLTAIFQVFMFIILFTLRFPEKQPMEPFIPIQPTMAPE